MREILFRGKRKDDGEWIEGSLLNFRENTYIIPHDSEYCYDDTEKLAFDVEYFEVLPETVGQYTGLTDKNGKKIFENDIFQALKPVSCGEYPNKFCIIDIRITSTFTWSSIRQSEIIGNIHDNPELLKGKSE